MVMKPSGMYHLNLVKIAEEQCSQGHRQRLDQSGWRKKSPKLIWSHTRPRNANSKWSAIAHHLWVGVNKLAASWCATSGWTQDQ